MKLIDRIIRWIDPGDNDEPEGKDDIAILRSMAERGYPVDTTDPALADATGLNLLPPGSNKFV